MTALGFRKEWYPLMICTSTVLAVELALILLYTHGTFTYTLDDAYIHLSLAENLARFGHYGINLGEYASPSSSIIWPLLLTPFFSFGLGAYAPLILNLLFALATVIVIYRMIADPASAYGKQISHRSWIWALFIFFAANGFGIVFMGMEHSLHVLVTVAIMFFINRLQVACDKGTATGAGAGDLLLGLCIVLSPLIRFEGLAVSAFAVAMLVRLGKPRLALLSLVLLGLSLAVYFSAMSALGLPLLPSSVLVKSAAAADITTQAGIAGKLLGAASHAAGNFVDNVVNREALLLLVMTFLLVVQAIRARQSGERVSYFYVAGVLLAVCLHLAFGRFWYGRYESYISAFVMCAALYVFSGFLFGERANSPAKQKQLKALGVLSVPAVMVFGFQQAVAPLITIPLAAQNIYEQQRQMREFVTHDWKAPVAVNDIGFVSFENDAYVLDLLGLGSEEARRLWRSGDRDVLRKLTRKNDIHLAMIYDSSFPGLIPAEWRKIADLKLSSPRITPSDDRVSFYVFGMDRARCLDAAAGIERFALTLVRPDTLTVDASRCGLSETAQAG